MRLWRNFAPFLALSVCIPRALRTLRAAHRYYHRSSSARLGECSTEQAKRQGQDKRARGAPLTLNQLRAGGADKAALPLTH